MYMIRDCSYLRVDSECCLLQNNRGLLLTAPDVCNESTRLDFHLRSRIQKLHKKPSASLINESQNIYDDNACFQIVLLLNLYSTNRKLLPGNHVISNPDEDEAASTNVSMQLRYHAIIELFQRSTISLSFLPNNCLVECKYQSLRKHPSPKIKKLSITSILNCGPYGKQMRKYMKI